MKRILLFGASGSIGGSTLDIVRKHGDAFQVVGLAVHTRCERLADWIAEFEPEAVLVSDPESRQRWAESRPDLAHRLLPPGAGAAELTALEADLVVNGVLGFAGLEVTLAAVSRGRDVALANKESLVCGGELLLQAAKRQGARLLPVDSEHNALFQLLEGKAPEAIRRVYLTASGGPFLRRGKDELADVSPAQALRHPTWKMGPKITVDSATLMNKGFEVIEAALLFDLPVEKIGVLVHPGSTAHALLEMEDSSLFCQLAAPDMRQPILHALSYPQRQASDFGRVDLSLPLRLEFEALDEERFEAVSLARTAHSRGGTAALALNAADEVAVAAFLAGDLRFDRIVTLAADVMAREPWPAVASFTELVASDDRARRYAAEWLETQPSMP